MMCLHVDQNIKTRLKYEQRLQELKVIIDQKDAEINKKDTIKKELSDVYEPSFFS